MPRRAFISGPLDADTAYFTQHYIPLLLPAIAAGHHFIMGPANGVDASALRWLLGLRDADENITVQSTQDNTSVPPSHITVYMAHFEYLDVERRQRYLDLGVNVKDVEHASTTGERDGEMTRDSDYDVLRYRTEAEAKALYGQNWWPRVSNTEMNERRRRGVHSREYDLGGGEKGKKEKEKEKEIDRKSVKKKLWGLFGKGR